MGERNNRLASGKNPWARIFSVVISTLPPFFCSSHLIALKEICGNIPWTTSTRCWRRASSWAVGRRDAAGVAAEGVEAGAVGGGGVEERHRKKR